jgi:hypothetical protein
MTRAESCASLYPRPNDPFQRAMTWAALCERDRQGTRRIGQEHQSSVRMWAAGKNPNPRLARPWKIL